MDWNKIIKARSLIQSDFYNDPEIYDAILERCVDPMLTALRPCPLGKASQYRNIAAEILVHSLGKVVTNALMRKVHPCSAGRGDFEIPLSKNGSPGYPLWDKWRDTFDIKSIIVETKNTKDRAAPGDVAHILEYIVTANVGKFGILVSRNGFTKKAMARLRAIMAANEFLILPFCQKDLEYLATDGKDNTKKCMKVFRRKAASLAQCA